MKHQVSGHSSLQEKFIYSKHGDRLFAYTVISTSILCVVLAIVFYALTNKSVFNI